MYHNGHLYEGSLHPNASPWSRLWDVIRERILDGLGAVAAQGHTGGRPPAADLDIFAVAVARRARGGLVTTVAQRLQIGWSTFWHWGALHLVQALAPRV